MKCCNAENIGVRKVDKYIDFWKNKRVLLTGHTGFKGTWMSILLESLGAKVCGYSLPLDVTSFYSAVKATVERHYEGDIADKIKLSKVIESFNPEIVIHLASHSSLDGSDRIPHFILQTNIMGVVNLLDIIREKSDVKSVLIVTSDKCYKNLETTFPYTENCDLGGDDPYSISKVCQELIANCYQKFFFENKDALSKTCIATGRASNVIGIGDYNITRLIPYLLESFKNGRCAILRNPDAIRPWQYILDVLWGYLLLAQKLYESCGLTNENNGPYNLGPDETGFCSVREIVENLAEFFPNAQYIFGNINRSVKAETNILKLDSSKAKMKLRWKTLYHIREILQETADITIKEQKGEDISILCRVIVKSYLERVRHIETDAN